MDLLASLVLLENLSYHEPISEIDSALICVRAWL